MENCAGTGRGWYDLEENSRIKEIYSKFTIKDFWTFWSGDSSKYMEIRIKDFKVIEEVVQKFNLPYSSSGVYVNSYEKLKNTIAFCRDKATIWMGVQPRRMSLNHIGQKVFQGKDINVDEIAFIFVDIDRVLKAGPASVLNLKNSDIMCNEILQQLNKYDMGKNYCKICSGNGVQLLIKLDIPIKMPVLDYETKIMVSKKGKEYQAYILKDNYEFEKQKILFTVGLKAQILGYCNRKLKKELGVFADSLAFKLSQVSALPFTKNFKYGGFTWRGIVELNDKESNDGLSDYILSIKVQDISRESVFARKPKAADSRHVLRLKTLHNHPLSRIMFDNDLPYGRINNVIWCQFKCLVRDFKLNMKSPFFHAFVHELEEKYKGNFTTNLPAENISFSEDVVNDYCLEVGIALPYKYLSSRIKPSGLMLDNFRFEQWTFYDDKENIIFDGDNIKEDMKKAKSHMRKGDYGNVEIYGRFINGLVKKYGKEKVEYWWTNNILTRFFLYD